MSDSDQLAGIYVHGQPVTKWPVHGGLIPTHGKPLGQSNPYAAYALALDFKNGQYWANGVQYAGASALPGYSYTRTGTEAFVNNSGGISSFADNVPPIIPGIGYEAYGAVTNSCLNSSNFSTSWVSSATTVTADSVIAPDGTQTADTLEGTSGTSGVRSPGITVAAATTYTFSFFVKRGTASNLGFRFYDATNGAEISSGSYYSETLASGWTRIVRVFTTPVSCTQVYVYPFYQNGLAVTGTVNVWQAQLLQGSFPDGGPIIPTTTAAASVGADSLPLTVPSGSYTATYTFSDGTTQTIATTVSGNTFTFPVYPTTLNKPAIALLTLEAA